LSFLSEKIAALQELNLRGLSPDRPWVNHRPQIGGLARVSSWGSGFDATIAK
jgi:hypothetical protein